MKTFKILGFAAILFAVGLLAAPTVSAGSGYSIGFSYSSGHHKSYRHHGYHQSYRPYSYHRYYRPSYRYGRGCDSWGFAYTYVAPPTYYYYSPPPPRVVYREYYPAPVYRGRAPVYYYENGSFTLR